MRQLLAECDAANFDVPISISLAKIVSVGQFQNIQRVRIHQCQTTDVGALQNVPHVELVRCPNLRDIALLGAQQSVLIVNCPVSDIRSLSRVPSITLHDCRALKDVSCLGSQIRLSLYCCDGITDYRTLTRVRNLIIGYASGLTELPAMENDHLTIRRCYRLTDISRLKSVGTLVIDQSEHHREPTMLAGTQALARVRERVVLLNIDISDLRPLRGGQDGILIKHRAHSRRDPSCRLSNSLLIPMLRGHGHRPAKKCAQGERRILRRRHRLVGAAQPPLVCLRIPVRGRRGGHTNLPRAGILLPALRLLLHGAREDSPAQSISKDPTLRPLHPT